ncbi:hypothetical protein [Nocardioides humi]|uniref:hypothetical protein n=1 Tax=Nocardioides humi TaxID=449461 RepID=UPI0015E869E9|nr:hypothetical protein [Nocardioides humi]
MANVWGTSSTVGRTRGMAALVALLLAAGLLVAGQGSVSRAEAAAVAAPAAVSTTSAAEAATKRKPNPAFVVKPGIVFNHPFKKKKRTKIQRKIIKTVKNVEAGQTIRLMTWNFDSPIYNKVFIAAHKRGVSVQIIMARGLARGRAPAARTPCCATRSRRATPTGPRSCAAGSAPASPPAAARAARCTPS